MSNETKWTKGPWWIEAETGDVVAKDGDWVICTFSRSDMQHEHDTHLIAAAPDLYEAVNGLLEALPSSTTHPAIRAARAALAKARVEA